MPKINYPQTNFTGGEISPKLRGRVDIQPVQNGAEVLLNVLCVAQGGALRRWGLQYLAETKDSTARSRLIPFVFNNDQAYMIEAGNGYARFFDQDGAQILSGMSPYELVTPYNTAQVLEVDYTQGGDTMFLFSLDVYPQRLRRIADDSWSIGNAPFLTEPFAEIGFKPATTLTLSSAAVGSRTFTAGAATFFPSDVGRFVYAGGGIAEITAYTSTTVVTANVTQAFASTSIASGAWLIDGSPQLYCQPSASEPPGQAITLTLTDTSGGTAATITNIARSGEEVTVTTSAAHGFTASMDIVISGVNPQSYNGTFAIEDVPTATTFRVTNIQPNSPPVSYGTATPIVYSGGGGWRAADVGKYVRINGGIAKITAIVSDSVADAQILQSASSTVAAPPLAWTLEANVWSTDNGYPRTGTIYQQRLWTGGSSGFPISIWGTVLGEYLDFLPGALATDAVSYIASTDRFDPILQLTHCKTLVALTGGAEITLGAGSVQAIGPANPPRIDEQSNYGAAKVAPERVGNELLFVQAGGQRIRAMSPDQYDARNYGAFDLSAVAEHLYRVGVEQISYQKTPEPILWHVLSDGRMAALSLDREQSLIATTQIVTDGEFEDVATFPGSNGEETWVIVKRTIGGVTKRYVERFVPDRHTDSFILGTSVGGDTVWSNLDHLEGELVDCLADGVDMGQFTVTSGAITLPRPAFAVEIGLNYLSRILTLTPEIGTGSGSSQGDRCKINWATIRLLNTVGGELDGTDLQARKLAPGVIGVAVPPFTGDVVESKLGWAKGVAQLDITQSRPLPFHVLGVFYKITINEG